jgi:hypothetical protein
MMKAGAGWLELSPLCWSGAGFSLLLLLLPLPLRLLLA